MTLSVVYVAQTGHVVGARGVTGEDAVTDLASLIGTELTLRKSLETGDLAAVSLRPGQLAAGSVDDEPRVFAGPLTFGADVEGGVLKPALLELSPWHDGLALKETTFEVSVPVAVGPATPVVVLLAGDAGTTLLTGEIPAQGKTVAFQVDLKKDDVHAVLVLVAGQTGRFEALKVS